MHDKPSGSDARPHQPDLQKDLAPVLDQDSAPIRRQARRLRVWALVVLVPVAVIGAALSFRSLYRAAEPVFGPQLALGFPLLVDFLILGTSLQYVAGAKVGRPRAGWRWTAHAGVAGTLFLNALAARTLREAPWHVTAPAVWSVLVEMTAREVLGQWRAIHAPLSDRIPVRLWLTAPMESARTWLRIARRVEGEQAAARLDVGVHAAAVEALKLALPQRRARRVRRILRRQLRAGSLPPAAILGPLGWIDGAAALTDITPESVLRAALRDTLHGSAIGPAVRVLPTAPTAAEQEGSPAARTEHVVQAAPTTSPVFIEAPAERPGTADGAPAPLGDGSSQPPATTPGEAAAEPARGTAQGAVTQETVIDLTDLPVKTPARPRRGPVRGAGGSPRMSEQRAEDIDAIPSGLPAPSSGDRFSDAVGIVGVHETITAARLATQLRALGWQLSDRTAGRILVEAREHLLQNDPWALPTP